jgi:hypothetical protein
VNVLICGFGKGSFRVRGIQLGGAIGARVKTSPTDEDFAWADVVVCIKRALFAYADRVKAFGKPLVWDALDFWAQPESNSMTEAEAKEMLRHVIAQTRPDLVIGATEAMAEAAGGVYLPHHSRPGLTPAPAREVVSTVGYEGTRKYLGRWGKAVQQECNRRGWTFVVNPSDLRDLDIVVAFRDAEHDGWMCREWKSGVKLVNALAAGRPMVTQVNDAALDIYGSRSGGTVSFVEHETDLEPVFNAWCHHVWRSTHADWCVEQAPAFTLSAIAERYRQILGTVRKAKAA